MAAVVALDEWRERETLEPEGWVRASEPERRICERCGNVRLDGVYCNCQGN